MFEAYAVAVLVSRRVDDITDVAQLKRGAIVALLSTLGACSISALVVSIVLATAGAANFSETYAVWFVSHVLGMVISATLTVTALDQGVRLLGRREQRVELALTIALTAAVCFAVFAQARYPFLFLIHLPLLLAVFRHRFSGVVFGTSAVVLIASAMTLSGHGPFMLVAQADSTERTLLLQLFIASTCLLSMPVAIVLAERSLFERQLRDSEARYRTLADNSRDLIVRLRADGVRSYVSPSATDLLGWSADELSELRWDLVHPADLAPVKDVLDALFTKGGAATIVYRLRHKDGNYRWFEARGSRVPDSTGELPEIIYSGRDVTSRVEAEQALEENRRRTQAIIDSLPAFVVHFDAHHRCTFSNAYAGNVLGRTPAELVGCSVGEVLGEENLGAIETHVAAVVRGKDVAFEIEHDFQGQLYHYQAIYTPDLGKDGMSNGFYAVMFDISRLKFAERELTRLSRSDALTGLANRHRFNECMQLALARCRRGAAPVALLYLDIDRFKHINDELGHAVGDVVLQRFARRIQECVREVDLVARLGGDEFVVLLENVERLEVPETIARRIIETMQESIPALQVRLRVSTSIGIGTFRDVVPTLDELMHLADQALYEAKAGGRNTYRIAACT